MEPKRTKGKKRKKSTYVLWTVLFFVYLGLAFNTYATERLNKKYNSVVPWNSELRRFCEYNGNEYVVSGKCHFVDTGIGVDIQIYDVYYDEQHPNTTITFSVYENKFGKRKYMMGFDGNHEHNSGDENYYDPNYGGFLYLDENFNPVSKDGVRLDKDAIKLMNDLHEEVERIVEIANDKWDLDLHYEYQETVSYSWYNRTF